MSIAVQHRRGTATEHSTFTGAEGEITVDTTNKRLRLHDGSTAGGIPVAKLSEIGSSNPVRDRIYIPAGSDLGYDDEFDDGSIDAGWASIDVSGSENLWYEPTNCKGLSFQCTPVNNAKLLGKIKSISGLSSPFYLETAIEYMSIPQQYPRIGLMLSTTNTVGSGYQVDGGLYWNNSEHSGIIKTWSNFTTIVSDDGGDALDSTGAHREIYLRLRFDGSTVYVYTSIDGVVWQLKKSKAWAYTPAYAGLALQPGNGYVFQGRFMYFRARSGAPANG